MDFIGITRLNKEGQKVNEFVATCPDHGYYYKGMPPMTSGCRECWTAYFVSEWAINGAHKEHIDELEAVIRHAAESSAKGEFEFHPEFEMKIEKESN